MRALSGLGASIGRAALVVAVWSLGCAGDDDAAAERVERDGGPHTEASDAATTDAADETDASSAAEHDGLRVRITGGVVEGSREGATRRFLGIPFAAAPVGARRWQPPAAVEPWSGVCAATQPASACPQATAFGPLPGTSEDCLYANVW